MKKYSLLTSVVPALLGLMVACTEPAKSEPPKPEPPKPAQPVAPKPAEPTPAAAPRDAGGGDVHLGMMEKYEIWKAKKAADEKLAAELAAEEQARLLKFDKKNLAKHQGLLAFIKKTRKQIDDAAEKMKGEPDAAAKMEKLANSLRKPIEAQAAILRKMDPQGGNSNIATDHDVSLNYLANDYPAAWAASFAGDAKPLEEARKELDQRITKIEKWLETAKASK